MDEPFLFDKKEMLAIMSMTERILTDTLNAANHNTPIGQQVLRLKHESNLDLRQLREKCIWVLRQMGVV